MLKVNLKFRLVCYDLILVHVILLHVFMFCSRAVFFFY